MHLQKHMQDASETHIIDSNNLVPHLRSHNWSTVRDYLNDILLTGWAWKEYSKNIKAENEILHQWNDTGEALNRPVKLIDTRWKHTRLETNIRKLNLLKMCLIRWFLPGISVLFCSESHLAIRIRLLWGTIHTSYLIRSGVISMYLFVII